MDQEYIIYLVVLRADLKVVVIKMRSVRFGWVFFSIMVAGKEWVNC